MKRTFQTAKRSITDPSVRFGAVVRCLIVALLVTGCELASGGVRTSYLAPGPAGATDRIRSVAEAHADAGNVDRFALARLQSFTVTEVRLAKTFATISEGASDAGDTSGRVARIVITRYADGKDGLNAMSKQIRGEVYLFEGQGVLAVYEIEKLSASGPLISSSLRSVDRAFAEKAARAILGYE
jgi:hypothetical protein